MSEEKQNPIQSAPYEIPLTKAFDKLTSEIFIFLLAYVILVIGLANFGENLAKTLKTLLYVIPVLGVAAYVWQNQKTIRKKGIDNGVDVRAGVVIGDAQVIGDATGSDSGNVKVNVGFADGRGKIFGRQNGEAKNPENEKSGDTSEKYLFEQIAKLDEATKDELVGYVLKLVRKQGTQK